ncbi:MAG: ABC transporter permease [Alphaproteobacteria bacterium]|nr:ABC transporter permease [Alphaproteobacteria bacterium]
MRNKRQALKSFDKGKMAMLGNYIKVAYRNIVKNRIYTVINLLSLAIGLSVFLFSSLFIHYEYTNDVFFQKHDRIYTLGSKINENANIGIDQVNAVPSAITPLIKAELPEIEAVSRTIVRKLLFTVGGDAFYQKARFADAALLRIFDFEYIQGDETALDNPTGIVITETAAKKYFGDKNPIGHRMMINHKTDMVVRAVIRDVPANSQFNSYFIERTPFEILLPIASMESITGFHPDTNWEDSYPINMTYVLLPENLDQDWLNSQLRGIYARHYPEQAKSFITGLFALPLVEANIATWQLINLPIFTTVRILGLLVLLIACVNYINLATAMAMKRTREVGLRKTLGAGPFQLLLQFITESLVVTSNAMMLAIALLEFIIPLFNLVTGRALSMIYVSTLPWLLLTVLIVGFISGSYPAYQIIKTAAGEALRTSGIKGKSSSWVRGLMLGVQFTISVFILALVFVVMAQNNRVEEKSTIFPKDRIYTLDGLDQAEIAKARESLRNAMKAIPGVENFSLSSQVPFEGTITSNSVSTTLNDFSNTVNIDQINIDHEFLDAYDIALVTGRKLSLQDFQKPDDGRFNVVVNEMALKSLKIANPNEAIGREFYLDMGENNVITYHIIGVMEDKNILGFHNDIKPFYMFSKPDGYRIASIRLSASANQKQTIEAINTAWKRVIPDYPVQGRPLTDIFQDMYGIFEWITKSLGAFSLLAFFLALTGLFSLSAFMAEQRTKEIGIRKVYGATPGQIVQFLILQFSKPVMWALPFAIAFAYVASNTYLEFFDDPIALPYGSLLMAGLIGLILSFITAACQAYSVAMRSPVNALHHE